MTTEADRERALAAAHALLQPGGRLVFDVFAPGKADIEATNGRWLEREPGIFERADWDEGGRTLTLSVRRGDEASTMHLAWLSPIEWRRLLERAGFEIEAHYAWFDRQPSPAKGFVFVARRPGCRGALEQDDLVADGDLAAFDHAREHPAPPLQLLAQALAELIHLVTGVADHRDLEHSLADADSLADRPLLDVVPVDGDVLAGHARLEPELVEMLLGGEQHLALRRVRVRAARETVVGTACTRSWAADRPLLRAGEVKSAATVAMARGYQPARLSP